MNDADPPVQKLTIPEQLDAAQNGEQFGAVLNNLFAALEKYKYSDE